MVVSPTAVYRCLKLETFPLSKFAQWETTFQVLTILGTLPALLFALLFAIVRFTETGE